MASPTRTCEDEDCEEEEDEYDNSESEDGLPTHETDQIEDGILDILIRRIKHISETEELGKWIQDVRASVSL